MCFTMTSRGCPSLSYIARKKSGSMMTIMPNAARLTFPNFLSRKKRRHADECRRPEADELPFGQVEQYFRFDLGEVARDRDIGCHVVLNQNFFSSIFCLLLPFLSITIMLTKTSFCSLQEFRLPPFLRLHEHFCPVTCAPALGQK